MLKADFLDDNVHGSAMARLIDMSGSARLSRLSEQLKRSDEVRELQRDMQDYVGSEEAGARAVVEAELLRVLQGIFEPAAVAPSVQDADVPPKQGNIVSS